MRSPVLSTRTIWSCLLALALEVAWSIGHIIVNPSVQDAVAEFATVIFQDLVRFGPVVLIGACLICICLHVNPGKSLWARKICSTSGLFGAVITVMRLFLIVPIIYRTATYGFADRLALLSIVLPLFALRELLIWLCISSVLVCVSYVVLIALILWDAIHQAIRSPRRQTSH